METELLHEAQRGTIKRAVKILQDGGLVAFPTDTIYGLGALPTRHDAVQRIYSVKTRNASNPIALLLASIEDLDGVAILPEEALPLVRRFWPGGITLVLKKAQDLYEGIGLGDTVGVRVPNLRLTLELIRQSGGRLAVTSANESGQPVTLAADEVLEQLGGKIEAVIDGGRSQGGVPSTVLDCTTWPPMILRTGAVPEAAIQATLRRASSASDNFTFRDKEIET
jgi:L-threonylcarbamoyladenylate synthase